MLLAARTLLVVPALTECLQDDRRVVRKTAAAALGKLGAHTTPAFEGLAEASDVCKAVAAASVPALAECLKDDCAKRALIRKEMGSCPRSIIGMSGHRWVCTAYCRVFVMLHPI